MPVNIKLNDHYRGDDWRGILQIGPVQVNTGTREVPVLEPMPNAFSSGRIQFRDANGALGYELSTTVTAGKGTITVTDAALWSFVVPVQALPLDEGLWFWDFETTDVTGVVLTPYYGTLKVNPDRSYD